MESISNVKFESLLDVVHKFPDEMACREYLEQQRWNGKIVCPHCQSKWKMYRLNGGHIFKCAECRKQFTVKVGTIFEDSALPLQKWFMAIYLLTAHKKGISSCQLARDIKVTQKTAWFMLHRIRHAFETKKSDAPLSNVVEADESYFGGKMTGGTTGRGSENKTPVLGMVERGGRVRSVPLRRATSKALKETITKNVQSGSTVITDEWPAYGVLYWEFNHRYIKHQDQWAKGDLHTNTIEGFWSLLKRGIFGIYHHVSPEHLHRYCDEFDFRYSTRKIQDTGRFGVMLNRCEGKLTYSNLTA